LTLIAQVTGINDLRYSRVLFGSVTSTVNTKIAQAGILLLVKQVLN